MPDTIRRGDQGAVVQRLQVLLTQHGFSVTQDGHFGAKTEEAVEAFQVRHNLYGDGIVGPLTWQTLEGKVPAPTVPAPVSNPQGFVGTARVPLQAPPGGYPSFTMRRDVAEAATRVVDALAAAGAVATTSGGMRDLGAVVTPTRSATSLHYLGLAWDLHVGSGMAVGAKIPYLVTRDSQLPRYWRVYARCSAEFGTQRKLPVVIAGQGVREITAQVVDLTEIMLQHGFHRIPSRPSSWDKIETDASVHAGTEWWHYQYEVGLQERVTAFGELLLRVHTGGQSLSTSPPWKYRDWLWGRGGFVAPPG